MPPDTASTNPDALAAMRLPAVRRYVLARVFSALAGQIATVAASWMLYERTRSVLALGIFGLCLLLPSLGLIVVAGNVADRYPRKKVAMLAYAVLAAAAIGLAVVSYEKAPALDIYALLVVFGAATSFTAPALNSILPQLVKAELYANANAWFSAALNGATIGGPAIAGYLLTLPGDATLAFEVSAAAYLLNIALIATFPRHPSQSSRRRDLAQVFAGFRFIHRSPIFHTVLLLDLFASLLAGAKALMPVYAKDILHTGPSGLGWMRAAPPVGALAMALLATRLPPWRRPGRALLLSVAGYGLATIGFGLSPTLLAAALFLALTGMFDQVSLVIRMTLEQHLTPDAMRGRVASVVAVTTRVADNLGLFESGATAAAWGAVPSAVLGGVGALAVVGLVALLRPQLARLGPLDSLKPEPG